MARKKGKELDSRAALLDAAWALLLAKGAGGMSVDAIVARAGLSKGTFFHFFTTKHDFLEALCTRIDDESRQATDRALGRSDLDAVARLDHFFQVTRAWRSERSKAVGGLWWELGRDENASLMRRVAALSIARLTPVMAALIEEGNARGLMRVVDVEVAARLVVEWIYTTIEGSLRLFLERRDAGAVDLALRRGNATIEAMERVLDIAPGSLTRVDGGIVSRLAADIPPAGEGENGLPARPDKAGPRTRSGMKGGSSHGRRKSEHD